MTIATSTGPTATALDRSVALTERLANASARKSRPRTITGRAPCLSVRIPPAKSRLRRTAPTRTARRSDEDLIRAALLARPCGSEGISHPDQPLEVRDVAGRQRQVVDQGDGSDLLVERVIGIRDSKPSPDLRRVGAEGQDALGEPIDDVFQPPRETFRLMEVAASANELDAATQFADGQRRDKSESADLDDLFEEADHAATRPVAPR